MNQIHSVRQNAFATLKLVAAALVLMTGPMSVAADGSRFDIPVNLEDFRPPQRQVDHAEYRIKKVTMGGKEYGIAYQVISGYSRGSRFIGVCRWEVAKTVATCEDDQSAEGALAYNRVVELFSLEDRFPKIAISRANPPSDGVQKGQILDLDRGAAVPAPSRRTSN